MMNHKSLNMFLLVLALFTSAFSGAVFAEIGRKELRSRATDGEKFIQLGRPTKSNVIDPSQVIQVSWRPRLFLFRGFLSEEECDHLISLVRHENKHEGKGDWEKEDANKFSSNLDLSLLRGDEVVTRIEERISAWTFLPKENSNPLQILHFGYEDSKQNYNYIGNKSRLSDEPLAATVILYLSNVTEGGQVLFLESENEMLSDCAKGSYTLRPTKGNAILFFNVHLDGTPDTISNHGRCPVPESEMWCANKFFYLKGIHGAKDTPQIDGTDCNDEDESCPRWAAVGECQRNPVFMVGSPDYYGTCRKSCNAC